MRAGVDNLGMFKVFYVLFVGIFSTFSFYNWPSHLNTDFYEIKMPVHGSVVTKTVRNGAGVYNAYGFESNIMSKSLKRFYSVTQLKVGGVTLNQKFFEEYVKSFNEKLTIGLNGDLKVQTPKQIAVKNKSQVTLIESNIVSLDQEAKFQFYFDGRFIFIVGAILKLGQLEDSINQSFFESFKLKG